MPNRLASYPLSVANHILHITRSNHIPWMQTRLLHVHRTATPTIPESQAPPFLTHVAQHTTVEACCLTRPASTRVRDDPLQVMLLQHLPCDAPTASTKVAPERALREAAALPPERLRSMLA